LICRALTLLIVGIAALSGETVQLPGLKAPVEILRDRWGVPHIYAQNADDLFFANGYMNARDRLFQIDLWRRVGTGKLAEVLGPAHVARDRMSLLFRFRGDWNAEWKSYAPDARQILVAFTNGINAYIKSLNGKRTVEFQAAGYDPGLWIPEDCLARVSVMSMTRNAMREVARSQDVVHFGLEALLQHQPLHPSVPVGLPPGVNLAAIGYNVLRDFSAMVAASPPGGSNNWAVDGTRTLSGKPLLASDPHRVLEMPSLRKTVHLVAPGWNVIGAGEPSVPGIALGHNENIAFGFTITGTDQEDLYVEKLNPKNPDEYFYQGAWKRMVSEKPKVSVRGGNPHEVELRFTVHGPVVYEDRAHSVAYVLRSVALEPGGAGYMAMLSAARAKDWQGFRAAMTNFKTPSENMVYADRAGNIGWVVAGLAPIRPNWTGVLPVSGTGEFEWKGFVPAEEMPSAYNPAKHFLGTANNNILPPGYKRVLSYEWGPPYRAQRIEELLSQNKKFNVSDFEQMQQDVTSIPARRFQAVLRKWKPAAGQQTVITQMMLQWDGRVLANSVPALVFEIWLSKIPAAIWKNPDLAARTEIEVLLKTLESAADLSVLGSTLDATLHELTRFLGDNMTNWQWWKANRVMFKHPLNREQWNRGPLPRGGDGNTLNASGSNSGASYRQVIDLAEWDRSTMTNVPGESGDPASPHYSDLLQDWEAGKYHPMPYSRKAVEAATTERITLTPR
jgi:penicillin amidase